MLPDFVYTEKKDFIPLPNTNCTMNRSLLVHGSPEWTRSRANVVCGSELPSLVGVDPNRSRKRTLEQKQDMTPTFLDPIAERMCDLGKAYEPVALYEAQQHFMFPLVDLGSLRHNDDILLEGRPDAATIDPSSGKWIPIEVKTRAYPNPFDSEPYQTEFDVPLKHWVQLQSYMMLLDSPYGVLFSFSPRHGYKMYAQMCNQEFASQVVVPCVKSFEYGNLPPRVSSREKRYAIELLTWSLNNATYAL